MDYQEDDFQYQDNKRKNDHPPRWLELLLKSPVIAALVAGLFCFSISVVITANVDINKLLDGTDETKTPIAQAESPTPIVITATLEPEDEAPTQTPIIVTATPENAPTQTPFIVTATPRIPASQTLVIATPTSNQTQAVSTQRPMQYETISLEDYSTNSWQGYMGLLPGERILDDMPFEVGHEVSTQGCKDDAPATEINISVSISNPTIVYLLMNTGNGFSSYRMQKVGEIEFVTQNHEVFTYELILGQNIRDWAVNDANSTIVTTVDGTDTSEVWRGTAYDGREGRVDLIEIALPENFQDNSLDAINLIDTHSGTCIQLQALTIEITR